MDSGDMTRNEHGLWRSNGQGSATLAKRAIHWAGDVRAWLPVLLVLGVLFVGVPGIPGALDDEGVVTDWTAPKSYQLGIEDPASATHSKPVRVLGRMGETVTKKLIVRNYSPQNVQDVVLSIGLLKYDEFPPKTLPAPRIFLPAPANWQIEPRTVSIGTLDSEEQASFNLSIRLDKVGRYNLMLVATGRLDGAENETVLWENVWVELEPGSGHSQRVMVVRLIAMGMLAGCGAVFVLKRSRTPY